MGGANCTLRRCPTARSRRASLLLLGAAPAAPGRRSSASCRRAGRSRDLPSSRRRRGGRPPRAGERAHDERARRSPRSSEGEVRNSFLDGGSPGGPPLVSVEATAGTARPAPLIVVALPQGVSSRTTGATHHRVGAGLRGLAGLGVDPPAGARLHRRRRSHRARRGDGPRLAGRRDAAERRSSSTS